LGIASGSQIQHARPVLEIDIHRFLEINDFIRYHFEIIGLLKFEAVGQAMTIAAKLAPQPSDSFFRFTARNCGWREATAAGKIDAIRLRIAYILLKG